MTVSILNANLCSSGIGRLSGIVGLSRLIAQLMCGRLSAVPAGEGILGEGGEQILGEGGENIGGE